MRAYIKYDKYETNKITKILLDNNIEIITMTTTSNYDDMFVIRVKNKKELNDILIKLCKGCAHRVALIKTKNDGMLYNLKSIFT